MTDPARLEQYDQLLAGAKSVQSTKDYWKSVAENDPMQKLKIAWTEVQDILLKVGTIGLPPVISGLQTFNEVLKTFRANLPGDTAKTVGEGGVAGAVAGGIRGMRHGVAGAILGALAGGTAGIGLSTVPAAAYESIKEGTFWDRFKNWMVPGGGDAFNKPSGRVPGMLGPMLPGLLPRAPASFDDRFGFPGFGPRAPASFGDRFGFGGGTPAAPSSFVPPGPIGGMTGGQHQKAITVATNLNIDGRALASIVSEHLVGGGDTSGGTYGPGNAQYSAS
jgi:hypothetical protein